MSLIKKSGYFEMAGKTNGVIITSEGNPTQHLVTKRQALEIGEALVGISITPEEWLAIKEQIHASDLPAHDSQWEDLASAIQGVMEDPQFVAKIIGKK